MVEELSKSDRCNGAVGMVDNSHLAIPQYFCAATEGYCTMGGMFRPLDSSLFAVVFGKAAFSSTSRAFFIQGRHRMENFKEMYGRDPFRNTYWDDKRAKLEKIKIPTYIARFAHDSTAMNGLQIRISIQQKGTSYLYS
jgi:hypothetical protein